MTTSSLACVASRCAAAAVFTCLMNSSMPVHAEVGRVETVAPGVYFHEGDVGRKGHCNNGWIVFDDYVVVIDGNFPSGALEVIPKIGATTAKAKPVRFVVDTHHHGDHAYGNQVWFDQGATLVAHAGVLAEMRRLETGYFGGGPGRWEDVAKNRPDVAASKLKPPTVLFERELFFDDGTTRVELRHFGVAHTRGDGFAWVPKQRVLFTGDACVNGPYNFMGDGDTGEWVKTLEAARALRPKVICPGHGPMGGPEVLDNQIEYLVSLRAEVRKLVDSGMKSSELKAAGVVIKANLRKKEALSLYIGTMFDSQVEKIFGEFGGDSRK